MYCYVSMCIVVYSGTVPSPIFCAHKAYLSALVNCAVSATRDEWKRDITNAFTLNGSVTHNK
jgi:hypothetical protein